MGWTRCLVICALGLGVSCEGEFTSTDDPTRDTGFKDALTADLWVGDLSETDGAQPGVIELVSGGVSTLGGLAMTETKLEGKPDFEITEDGLEYLGVHGDQCAGDKVLCISEGGFAP